ncbi:Gfo/Idh/MocA family protein [candidate division KSB1 bacterium]
MSRKEYNRRDFLRSMSLGLGGAGLGLAGLAGRGSAAGGGKFRFVHMTDMHVQPERNGEAGLRAAIKAVNGLNPRPDLVITGGDLVMDALEQTYERADKRTGKKVTVTFNARYGPTARKIKEILMTGEIGEIESVDYNWFLDVYHGADYFRRWHGLKRFSGTLLVHKATHHFDMMNWWLDREPDEISAYGKLVKYGANGPFRGVNCRKCSHKDKCRFYWDITGDDFNMKLYVGCEDVDGYYRDGCVFREDIDIYDTMALRVKYAGGIHMTYSLNAFMPYEGYRIGFNGSEGRLDVRSYQRQPWDVEDAAEIKLTKIFAKKGEPKDIPVARVGGAHAGADPQIKDMILKPELPDPLNQRAGSRAGAMSILLGIAARKSIEEGRLIRVNDLVKFG